MTQEKKYRTMDTKNADNQKPKNDVSKRCAGRIKNINKHLKMTRKEHINWLAQPKAIRLKPYPDPELIRELPLKIERHTLYGRVPSRMEYLARPKIRNTQPEPVKVEVTGHNGYSKKRIEELAKPKSLAGHIHARCMDTEEKDIRYFKPNRLYSKMTIEEAKNFRKQWLAKNAAPKVRVVNVPKRDDKRLTLQQLQDLTTRLTKVSDEKLARMAQKPYVRPREPRPPVRTIRPMKLPWIDRLSKHKELSPEAIMDLEYDPYLIKKSTLRAKPSKRIIELAQPKIMNTNSQLQFKLNPYEVNPRALKYRATKRIKMLAIPRIRE